MRRSLLLSALPVRDSAVAKYSPKVGFLSLANDIAFGYRATKYQLIAKGDCYGCLYSPMLEWQAHASPFRNRKTLKQWAMILAVRHGFLIVLLVFIGGKQAAGFMFIIGLVFAAVSLTMIVIVARLADLMGCCYSFGLFNEGVITQVGLPASATLPVAWKVGPQPISLSNIVDAVRWQDVQYAEVDEPSRQMMLHRHSRSPFLLVCTADNVDRVYAFVWSKTRR